MAPRFESLPLEIRRMIYTYVLPRLQKTLKNDWGRLTLYHWTYVLHTADTAILRTNRYINQEASAVFYRNTLLVSIDWNTNSRAHLIHVKMPHAAFNFLRPGSPLPPYAVQVQHKYHPRSGRLPRGLPPTARGEARKRKKDVILGDFIAENWLQRGRASGADLASAQGTSRWSFRIKRGENSS